jgi:UDP-N-acetylglucosamine--N-acetylmuramyl-(pentapeptide) pyrophosphoryl-undecaprenol N-acetylglucosamine transferase
VLHALKNEVVEVLWVGGQGGMEAELVERAGVAFTGIPAAGLHGVGLRALPRNLAMLGRGYLAARRVLREYRPDALFFTGGYVAVPVALANRRAPVLMFVPDVEPGLALKFLARFADRIAVTTEDSRGYYSPRSRLAVTGYPARQDLSAWDKPRARRSLGLAPDQPTLLVFGGSLGARSINRALAAVLPALLEEIQVVHISGERDWPEVRAVRSGLAEPLQGRYAAFPYLHERMGAALGAADLALSRAGASSLGEYPLLGLPAVLVPYPHAWRYQRVNAQYLATRGAAVILEDAEIEEKLGIVALQILKDPQRLAEMSSAMRALARPDAAGEIADLLKAMIAGAHTQGSAGW